MGNRKIGFTETVLRDAGQSLIATRLAFDEMEPILVTLAPHQALENDTPHQGEEFGFVLSGRITVRIADRKYEVKAGESFYYGADRNHFIENPSGREARFLWVSTPPSF